MRILAFLRQVLLVGLLLIQLPLQAQVPTYLWAQPFMRSANGQLAGAYAGGRAAVDAAGYTYIVGSFNGLARFGALSLTSAGSNDVFVAKLDGQGNYLWAVAGGGAGDDQGADIALDAQGNLFVTGSLRSSPATFGPATTGSANGSLDLFVAKLSPAGQWLWATSGGGPDNDLAQGVATDGTNVFVAGYSQSRSATFGATTLANASSAPFVVTAKLDAATGAWGWAAGSSGPGGGQASQGYGWDVAADGSGGAYVVGDIGILATFGSITLQTAGDFHDTFVARLSPTGQWLWATRASAADDDAGLAIAVDAAYQPYITGYFFGPSIRFGSTTLTNPNRTLGAYAFVAKLTSAGTWAWASQVGGPGHAGGGALALDAAGDAYVAGTYGSAPVTFGNTALPAPGGEDAFVAKISGSGVWQWALAGGSPTDDTCRGVGVDGLGNVSFAGTFANPVSPAVFGPFSVAGNPNSTTGFVARVGIVQTVRISGDSLVCNGGQVRLQATPSVPAAAYAWSTGATTPSITVSQPGTYSVTATFAGGQTSSSTFRVAALSATARITGDSLLCPGRPAALLAVAPGALSYSWNTGATTAALNVTQPGTYTATARYGPGCSAMARFTVRAPAVRITGPEAWCPSSPPTLTAVAPGATAYHWNTGATTPTLGVAQPGTYTVTATFTNGCTLSASHTVSVPTLAIRGDTVLCPGRNVHLAAELPDATAYAWSTGATTPAITVGQPGLYRVTATYGAGCTRSAEMRVRTADALPAFTIGPDTTLCEGDALVLQVPALPGLTAVQWSDGSTASSLVVRQAGTYTLTVQTACEQRRATRRVELRNCLLVPNIITPNQDRLNDRFVVQGLPPGPWALRIYNRWGRLVFATDAYQQDWGETAAPGTYFYILTQPESARVIKGTVEVAR